MLRRAHIVGGWTRWLCRRSVMLNALTRSLPVNSFSMFLAMFLKHFFIKLVLKTLYYTHKSEGYDPTFACLLTLRRGGWWGRERPSRSSGSPWWSQGGEGSAGPGGLLRTNMLKMTHLDLSWTSNEKIPWSQCNLLY